MKSKTIGFTLKYVDEENVGVLPIVEYEDEETGFKFCDVSEKSFFEISREYQSREDVVKILEGLGIENAVQIMEAHIKMHKQNIAKFEEDIKKMEDNISFYENIYLKEENDYE